jgi:hypothetical protein
MLWRPIKVMQTAYRKLMPFVYLFFINKNRMSNFNNQVKKTHIEQCNIGLHTGAETRFFA